MIPQLLINRWFIMEMGTLEVEVPSVIVLLVKF